MTGRAPHVAILILNHNGSHFLDECLQSVIASEYSNLRIYLIDNASTDGSVQFVRSRYPSVDIMIMARNVGLSTAYNRAMAEVTADYYFLVNNDVTVEPRTVTDLVAGVHGADDIAAVTPKLLFSSDPKRVNGCGGMLDRYAFGLNVGIGELDAGQYDYPMEVFYAIGAAMLVKASAFVEVGGFDDRFFAYFEDADWCWRARLYGYRIQYIPTAAYHKWRGSWTDLKRRMYYQERNRLATILKNCSAGTLLRILPPYFGLALLRLAWVSIHWGPIVGLYMMAAYPWNCLQMPATLRARRRIQRRRGVPDGAILQVMARKSLELTHRKDPFLTVKR